MSKFFNKFKKLFSLAFLANFPHFEDKKIFLKKKKKKKKKKRNWLSHTQFLMSFWPYAKV